jgi:DNA-binding beta-propeller fold protein YncE
MRILTLGALALGGTLSVALAGCAGVSEQSSLVPGSPPALQSIARGHATLSVLDAAGARYSPPAALILGGGLLEDAKEASSLYVGQFYVSNIADYRLPDLKNGLPRCGISGELAVNGLGVNAEHIVYVPQGSGRLLDIYAPKCGALLASLNVPGGSQDSDVAFNEKTRTAWVDLTSPAGVIPIQYGALNFGTELTCSSLTRSFGVAVDDKGNVYASGANGSASTIVVWPGGTGTCSTLGVTGLGFPGGIVFDSNSNLIVDDVKNAMIDIFAPPYSGAATRTITPKGTPSYGKLDAKGVNYYVSNRSAGSADVFNYSTGAYEYSITNGLYESYAVEGIAVDPP